MEVALGSLTVPPVGAITVSEGTVTRIPSKRSSCSMPPAGLVSAGVRVMGVGNGLPELRKSTVMAPESSVIGALTGSAAGMNSDSVPTTRTSFPLAAAAGGALLVKTNTPSELLGSRSISASAAWMKNPLDLMPVTMPRVVTTVPTGSGEVRPGPWMSWIRV